MSGLGDFALGATTALVTHQLIKAFSDSDSCPASHREHSPVATATVSQPMVRDDVYQKIARKSTEEKWRVFCEAFNVELNVVCKKTCVHERREDFWWWMVDKLSPDDPPLEDKVWYCDPGNARRERYAATPEGLYNAMTGLVNRVISSYYVHVPEKLDDSQKARLFRFANSVLLLYLTESRGSLTPIAVMDAARFLAVSADYKFMELHDIFDVLNACKTGDCVTVSRIDLM